MHPIFIAAIVGGSILGTFFIYDIASNLYEEYQDRKQYEEYVRNYNARDEDYRQKPDREFDDDQIVNEKDRNDNYELRQRKKYSDDDDEKNNQDQYELSNLERSINERRRRLMAEQAFLDQEEKSLENRRYALQKSLSNESLSSSNHTQKAMRESYIPFDDTSSDGWSKENAKDKENSSDSLYHSLVNYNEPTELQFPAPSTAAHNSDSSSVNTTTTALPTTTTTRTTKSQSDSEESWDAVSQDDWLKSVDGSDEEHHFSD